MPPPAPHRVRARRLGASGHAGLDAPDHIVGKPTMFRFGRSGTSASAAATLAAIEHAQAVVEFDLDGNVMTANANFLATMGYALDEIRDGITGCS